ncbi:hypothetical protein RFI_08202 [Reticulomyxa filosa]|uniref:Uncharacterized protein n=1 Tax=Reticulomyxa filosa TaxID=46433 RepID=X6NSG4_RETFI|nr:hypothetical protein RFI_08202 [Reticulomyxa filosa]|eukprot:ETO28921.1 hypothetical protein RFI_08202 [Reticulomyxa filosa]
MGFNAHVAETAYIALLNENNGNPEAFSWEDCFNYIVNNNLSENNEPANEEAARDSKDNKSMDIITNNEVKDSKPETTEEEENLIEIEEVSQIVDVMPLQQVHPAIDDEIQPRPQNNAMTNKLQMQNADADADANATLHETKSENDNDNGNAGSNVNTSDNKSQEEKEAEKKLQEEKEDEEDQRYTGPKEPCPICTVERPTHKMFKGECGHVFCKSWCFFSFLFLFGISNQM